MQCAPTPNPNPRRRMATLHADSDDDLNLDLDTPEVNFFTDCDDETTNNNIYTCKYLTDDDFNSQYSLNSSTPNSKLLSLIHLNVRSFHSKFVTFENLLDNLKEKFDVIAISETWFTSDTPHSLFNLDGYTLHYASRKNKQGGGVALYISNHLHCKSTRVYCVENMYESIFIELSSGRSSSTLVSCVYRMPGSCINTFCNEFRQVLQAEIKPKQNIFICGDYNINLLKYEEHNPTRNFIDLMNSFSLKPTINKPTRITRHSQTLIDNIFTNEIVKPIETGILINDISDHLPIYNIVKQINSQSNTSTSINSILRRRKLDDETLLVLENSLQNTDWSPVLDASVTDVNIAYNTFLEKFLDTYNTSCPVQNIILKKKSKLKPWMTRGLKRACTHKNILYRKFLCCRTKHSEQQYKTYKNILTSSLREAEKNFYDSLLQRHMGDIKNTWRTINHIIGKGKMCNSFPTEFIDDGKTISSLQDICNRLNKFFTEIGPKLAEKIEVINESPLNYMQNTNQHSMLLRPATEFEVENIVKSCKKKESKDYHGISMTTLQKIFTTIKKPITHICNLSLTSGVFPDQMKIAKVIPLFKSGDKKMFNNYRPVSLLPQFSKILEKIFSNRLESFLNTYDILNEAQFGFRSKCNTTHALLKLIEGVSDSIDKRKSTIGIFIDLKKAFDTVNHSILAQKLDKYGIRGLSNDWIKSYLKNRKQFVSVNNCESQLMNISCGVPQGSILGPKLFILYINDMCNVTQIFEYILFADDTNLFCSNENVKVLYEQINDGLAKLKKWFAINKLSLNIEKTNYIKFSPGKSSINMNLMIGDKTIQRVTSTKFLGVTIHENLSWKLHIAEICSKMMKAVGIMNRMKTFLPQHTLKMLYNTLVAPHMTYSCEVWGTTYPSNITKIVTIQKKSLRIINRLNFLDHCEHLFDRKIMRFQQLVKFKISIFMFKVKMKILPPIIQTLFPTSNQPISTRNNNDFSLQHARTNYKLHCLSYAGVRLWNSLPPTIRNSPRISTLKKHLLQELCQSH